MCNELLKIRGNAHGCPIPRSVRTQGCQKQSYSRARNRPSGSAWHTNWQELLPIAHRILPAAGENRRLDIGVGKVGALARQRTNRQTAHRVSEQAKARVTEKHSASYPRKAPLLLPAPGQCCSRSSPQAGRHEGLPNTSPHTRAHTHASMRKVAGCSLLAEQKAGAFSAKLSFASALQPRVSRDRLGVLEAFLIEQQSSRHRP